MQLYAVQDLSEEQLRLLKKFINRGGCGDEIDEDQAIALIPKLSYVLLSETKKRRSEVNGFVFLREDFDYQPKRKQDPNLYVELICAENFTLFATLLEAVIAIGKEMKKKYISLSALPSVILLYARKFGFRLILHCESKEPGRLLYGSMLISRKENVSAFSIIGVWVERRPFTMGIAISKSIV